MWSFLLLQRRQSESGHLLNYKPVLTFILAFVGDGKACILVGPFHLSTLFAVLVFICLVDSITVTLFNFLTCLIEIHVSFPDMSSCCVCFVHVCVWVCGWGRILVKTCFHSESGKWWTGSPRQCPPPAILSLFCPLVFQTPFNLVSSPVHYSWLSPFFFFFLFFPVELDKSDAKFRVIFFKVTRTRKRDRAHTT